MADSSDLHNWGAVPPLRLASLQLLAELSSMPTAGPHQRLHCLLSSCSLLGYLCPTYACMLDALCREKGRYHEPPWHEHGHEHGLPLHITSAGKVGLASCLLCLCCPCANISGSEVCLNMRPSGWWWLHRCLFSLLSPCSLARLPACPTYACMLDVCAENMAAITNHHGTNMGSRRAGVACTLILQVSLAKHSASSALCCPCANSSGSEVWLPMELGGWWWLCCCCWLPFPWFLVPEPSVRSPHPDLVNDHACFWSLNPLGPQHLFCLANLLHEGAQSLGRLAVSALLWLDSECNIRRNVHSRTSATHRSRLL